MPGYRGHLVGGSCAFAFFYICFKSFCPSTITAIHWFIATLAGSLFPDIDVKSKGQKYGYWIIFFIFLILIIERRLELLAMLSVLSVTPMLVNHRGLFHKVWFVAAMPLLAHALISSCYPQWSRSLFFITLFFIIGSLSHLWLDFGLKRLITKNLYSF